MSHHLIRPCAECARPTRPPHFRLSDHPGTIVRRGPVCHTCRQYKLPTLTPAQERAHTYNMDGLRSFLRRRHERELAHARADHLHKYLERVSA